MLKAHGHDRSYVRESGLSEELGEWARERFHFPEAADINSIEYQPDPEDGNRSKYGIWWGDRRKPHRFDIDIEDVAKGSSLISGPVHLSELDTPKAWPITHKIYMMRDGRDQLVSLANYAMNEDCRERWPATTRYSTAREAFDGYLGYFASIWTRSAAEYLMSMGDPTVLHLRYETMLNDREGFIRRICRFLGLEEDEAIIKDVAEATSVEKSREHIPGHVDKAQTGRWREWFDEADLRAYYHYCGEMLYRLGYDELPPPSWARRIIGGEVRKV